MNRVLAEECQEKFAPVRASENTGNGNRGGGEEVREEGIRIGDEGEGGDVTSKSRLVSIAGEGGDKGGGGNATSAGRLQSREPSVLLVHLVQESPRFPVGPASKPTLIETV